MTTAGNSSRAPTRTVEDGGLTMQPEGMRRLYTSSAFLCPIYLVMSIFAWWEGDMDKMAGGALVKELHHG